MLEGWLELCNQMAVTPATLVSGARKIVRPVQYVMPYDPQDYIELSDCGYTNHKMGHLRRLYLVEESISAAVELWDRRLGQNKYGSVGFHCYNHFVKNDPEKKSKRASVMGPCLQSVTLTYLEKEGTGIDVFYRTTELFKKFPADLIFLQNELLPRFNFEQAPIRDITFHFANVTVHPMYYVTIIPHFSNPLRQLEIIREQDPYFHKWIVSWTSRYFIDEFHKGIQKFAQGLRVHKDANERVSERVKRQLIPYLKEHHHKKELIIEDDDE